VRLAAALLILLSVTAADTLAAEPAAPLVLERTIALKSIDYLAVDLDRRRLFVAELGNGTVGAIDIANGSVIRRIEGLKEPQRLAYAP
jgi:YVTN family beta-propeller protein